jgi:hypothetical protein
MKEVLNKIKEYWDDMSTFEKAIIIAVIFAIGQRVGKK